MSRSTNDSRKKLLGAAIALGGLAASPQGELTIEQIVRAWQSPEYRQTLTAEQISQLPSNPAGEIQFELPQGEKGILIANTSGWGCEPSGWGCQTSGWGCETSGWGCETSGWGCSTQFESCMA